ncbi:hypothetical protein BC833DRAFT_408038, partial [Globomyces pollinis-pini]
MNNLLIFIDLLTLATALPNSVKSLQLDKRLYQPPPPPGYYGDQECIDLPLCPYVDPTALDYSDKTPKPFDYCQAIVNGHFSSVTIAGITEKNKILYWGASDSDVEPKRVYSVEGSTFSKTTTDMTCLSSLDVWYSFGFIFEQTYKEPANFRTAKQLATLYSNLYKTLDPSPFGFDFYWEPIGATVPSNSFVKKRVDALKSLIESDGPNIRISLLGDRQDGLTAIGRKYVTKLIEAGIQFELNILLRDRPLSKPENAMDILDLVKEFIQDLPDSDPNQQFILTPTIGHGSSSDGKGGNIFSIDDANELSNNLFSRIQTDQDITCLSMWAIHRDYKFTTVNSNWDSCRSSGLEQERNEFFDTMLKICPTPSTTTTTSSPTTTTTTTTTT